jgi:fructose-bisphosphate aldolase/2-amino-3,7-dideoxy-D-threo-hept-6-ulosonate synthase
MTSIGKVMKMGRLFPDDDRLLITPHEGLRPDRRWVDVAKAVIKGGTDAILTTPGILMRHHEAVAGKVPFLLQTPLDPKYVDIAVSMDAVAVKWQYFGPIQNLPWWDVNRFAMECEEAGMPFLCEPVPMDKPRNEGGKNIDDPDVILGAALRGVANGADIIKCNYSGTPESFKKVTSRCPVPVVVLGGPLVPDKQCLEWVKGSVDGGAVGGAIGRNTTTHRDPEKIIRAIQKIIHDDASVDEALKELK